MKKTVLCLIAIVVAYAFSNVQNDTFSKEALAN